MSDMPDVLSVSLTEGEWSSYQCRSGRGGKNDTVYVKESAAEEKAKADKINLAKKYERLSILAVKHCPSYHDDWEEVKQLTLELDREILKIEAE